MLGEHAGQPTLRLITPPAGDGSDAQSEPVAEVMGFNVHAKVAVEAGDEERLERLCRYLARPPIAQERLEVVPDGRPLYSMKKSWKDGTHALVFDPLDLIARICAMIPPPRFNMIRFHGVLAPNAMLRSAVVPEPPDDLHSSQHGDQQLDFFDVPNPRMPRRPWAYLLKRVFAIDVTVCPKCAGSMRLVDIANTPETIAEGLAREGLAPRTLLRSSLRTAARQAAAATESGATRTAPPRLLPARGLIPQKRCRRT